MNCHFCGHPVNEEDPDTYHEVTSWVNGPKLDGPKLRERSGRMAHKTCVEHLVHGQAPDQPELLISDEPKIKGYNVIGEFVDEIDSFKGDKDD